MFGNKLLTIQEQAGTRLFVVIKSAKWGALFNKSILTTDDQAGSGKLVHLYALWKPYDFPPPVRCEQR